MRALDPEVMDVVWNAVEGLLPDRPDSHPLGCHRKRISDRLCFRGILIRLVTGCSWEDAERLLFSQVSDTTLRTRRDEWITNGVFDQLCEQAVGAYDRIIGLDLADVCIDGSQQKARCGGDGTGPNPADRGKTGWKWSIAVDGEGVPIGWAIAPANRHDSKLVEPTLAAITSRGLHHDIETIHADMTTSSSMTSSPLPGSKTSTSHARRSEASPSRFVPPSESTTVGLLNEPTRGSSTTDSSEETPTAKQNTDSRSWP